MSIKGFGLPKLISATRVPLAVPITVCLIAVLIASVPLPGLANDHKNSTGQSNGQANRFRSIDAATSHVLNQHPGAKIVKVVQKKQADGSHIAQFRILTADGRMKKINVNVE